MSTSAHPSAHAGAALTLARVTPILPGGLAVASPALGDGGWIDDRYSAWCDDLVPEVGWTRVLEAQTYALVVEDPDAPGDRPFLHWVVWNIPGDVDGIPAGLSRTAHPPELPGAVQGRNSAGSHGWHGTRPPEGGGPHRYHFQVFALSGRLNHLSAEAGLEELVDALKGMTLTAGEAVGLYERRDPLETPPPREDPRAGLDADDVDAHAPHDPEGSVLQRPGAPT